MSAGVTGNVRGSPSVRMVHLLGTINVYKMAVHLQIEMLHYTFEGCKLIL